MGYQSRWVGLGKGVIITADINEAIEVINELLRGTMAKQEDE